jgi:hypothetical protein
VACGAAERHARPPCTSHPPLQLPLPADAASPAAQAAALLRGAHARGRHARGRHARRRHARRRHARAHLQGQAGRSRVSAAAHTMPTSTGHHVAPAGTTRNAAMLRRQGAAQRQQRQHLPRAAHLPPPSWTLAGPDRQQGAAPRQRHPPPAAASPAASSQGAAASCPGAAASCRGAACLRSSRRGWALPAWARCRLHGAGGQQGAAEPAAVQVRAPPCPNRQRDLGPRRLASWRITAGGGSSSSSSVRCR